MEFSSFNLDFSEFIGEPLIFGRYHPTLRGGIWLYTHGVINLCKNGKFGGTYHSSNEENWFLDEGRLIFKDTNGRASAIFYQADGHYLLGYGLVRNHPTGLALARYKPLDETERITFCIATCPAYADRTIPPLLEWLVTRGVGPASIVVCMNNSYLDGYSRDGINYLFTPHNFYEYSAFVAMENFPSQSLICLLHDTVSFGDQFLDRLHASYSTFLNPDFVPFHGLGHTSMGIYNSKYFHSLASVVRNKGFEAVCSKAEAVNLEWSGWPHHLARHVISALGSFGEGEVRGDLFSYQNSNTTRVTRYFHAVDLKKYTRVDHFGETNVL